MPTTTVERSLLDELRRCLSDMIGYAKYKVNSTWYNSPIEKKDIKPNGTVCIYFYIEAKDSDYSPATEFQLYTAGDVLLVDRAEEVAFSAGLSKFLYQFRFDISVGEEESE